MARDREPVHDRVQLTPSERAALAELERSLREEEPVGGLRRWPRSRVVLAGRVDLSRLAATLVGFAPWIALVAALVLPVAIAVSTAAGAGCAVVLTLALTVWGVDRLVRLRSRPAGEKRT